MTDLKVVPFPKTAPHRTVQETLETALAADLPNVLVLALMPDGNIRYFENGALTIGEANFMVDGYKLEILLEARKTQ